ncbi:MAG: hypothetical protein M3Y91_14085 [Actinomycetota bacterium]|nr:hypothetical protein [Actinomycetota bacterium]
MLQLPSHVRSLAAAPSRRAEPPIETLIRAMLASLAVGLLIAAAMLVFHDQIVSHQVATHHGLTAAQRTSVRQSAGITLWTRPAVPVAVAVLYPIFFRRLRRHERRGWRRTVIVAVAQIVLLAWYTTGLGYPAWLVSAEIVQALLAANVLRCALRPSVRRYFPTPPPA